VKTSMKNVVVNEDTLKMIQEIRASILGDMAEDVKISDSAIIRKSIEQFYYDVCGVSRGSAILHRTGQ
jgi:hypothetical protein